MRNNALAACWALACLLGASACAAQALAPGNAAAAPSTASVQQWWKNHSDEEMKIEGEPIETRLENRELAYLVPVSFFGRGRNDIWHMVLVRPALREVREMAFPMRSATVLDLDHDGVSEVVARQVASGQGTNVVVDSILHIDGWTPRLLHQVKSGDNLGECTTPPDQGPCKSTKVDWQFQDAKGQRSVALTETITTTMGAAPGETLHRKRGAGASSNAPRETVWTTVNRYSFTGDRFVRMTGPLEK